MLLQGGFNRKADLHLKGFEDGPSSDAEEDWLLVELNLEVDKHKFHVVDPALTTADVRTLINWLQRLSKNEPVPALLHFIEPCLSLWVLQSTNDMKLLRFTFAAEMKPEWYSERECSVVCYLTNKQVAKLAKSLQHELYKLYIKAGLTLFN